MIETKFKQTEIGLIPKDWEIIPLRDVAENYTGLTYSPDNVHSYGTLVLRSSNIQGFQLCFDDNVYVIMDIPQRAIVRNEDILVCVRNGSQQLIGKSAKITPEADGMAFGAFMTILRPKNIDGDFLLYVWRSRIIQKQIEEVLGATINQITNADLKSFIVLNPSPREQKSIANALSNIDNLISSLSKTIEKKRLIKQGAMQQLLTGKKRLPGFDGEWEKHKIGDFLSILKGYGLSKSHLVQDGENKCILYGELFTKYDYEIKTCISRTDSDEGLLSECGDILMPGSTTTNGIDLAKAVSVYESNIHLGGDIVVLRDKKIVEYEPYFVSAQITELCKQAIEQSSQGITIIHLNTRELRNVEIILPLARKEQLAIANVLRTMDNEIESLEEERDKYIRLKEGMMQKLLTGQIRLVEAETKQKDLPKAKAANVYFKRSVLAAEIADRLCEERTFGHVKMEKLIFLTEHLCHIDIDSHYHRDAAGPYDNRALRSIDSQMKKQKWFEAKKEDKGYRYIPMQNRGGHKKYFEKYYADSMPMFEKIIDTFRSSTTEQCEIVATLYSAWDDLLQSHKSFTDDDILNEVLNNWHESKKRISRNRWQTELDWMRVNGFVPQTENN
ncbi:MAG: restriction endonuclease subunit S [Bacteroidales bacterium]|nr:restriction endonuclease subunit S [Bacteroidales bacterium]